MFRFAVLLAFLMSATAFMVPKAMRSTVTMMADKSEAVPFLEAPANLKGAIGYKGFDPLGFSNFLPVKFLQEAEIKHSRIAMLATLGFVATEFVKLPGAVHDVSPVAAHDAAVASGSGFQVLATIAALEFIGVVALKQTLDGGDRQPGEFGFDPLNLWGKTQKDKDVMAEKEIANGRTAMLAFAGIVTQAVLNDKGFPYA